MELLTFHLLASWGETVHWLPCIPGGVGGWRKVELMGDGQMVPLFPSLSTKFIRLPVLHEVQESYSKNTHFDRYMCMV